MQLQQDLADLLGEELTSASTFSFAASTKFMTKKLYVRLVNRTIEFGDVLLTVDVHPGETRDYKLSHILNIVWNNHYVIWKCVCMLHLDFYQRTALQNAACSRN